MLRPLLFALATAVVSMPTVATAQNPKFLFTGGDTVYLADSQEIDTSKDLVARRGEPLLQRTIRARSSVVLKSQTVVRTTWSRQVLEAGTVMFAAGDPERGTFCAPGRGGDWAGVTYACLKDSDGDGFFDKQQHSVVEINAQDQVFGPSLRGRIETFGLRANGTDLAEPVAYEAVDIDQATRTSVDLVWRASRIRNSSAYRVELGTNGNAGFRNVTRLSEFVVDTDRPQNVLVDGVYLEVKGVLQDGSLSYRVHGINVEHFIVYQRFTPAMILTLYL